MEHPIQFEREVPPQALRRQWWIARWLAQRQRGPLSYVLLHGILKQGIVFATFLALGQWFGLVGKPHQNEPSYIVFSFLFTAVFFGSLCGYESWRRNEKTFNSFTETKQIE